MNWLEQVEEIAGHVVALLARREGDLAALSLTVPAHLRPDDVKRVLAARLAQEGMASVEISTHIADGPLRLISMEFVR